jgi:hypothetical protein
MVESLWMRKAHLKVGRWEREMGNTAVATGSMRKLLRLGEILTPRDADDGVGGKRVRGEWRVVCGVEVATAR